MAKFPDYLFSTSVNIFAEQANMIGQKVSKLFHQDLHIHGLIQTTLHKCRQSEDQGNFNMNALWKHMPKNINLMELWKAGLSEYQLLLYVVVQILMMNISLNSYVENIPHTCR